MKRWLGRAAPWSRGRASRCPPASPSGPRLPVRRRGRPHRPRPEPAGYGPRPGDVETVRAMGLDEWIERQLHPERIDDGALRAAAGRAPTRWACPWPELIEGYELPREAKREIQKKRAEMDGRLRGGHAAGAARVHAEVRRLADAGPPAPGRGGAAGGQGPARRLQRAPARRGAGRLLDEPLQRLRGKGAGEVPGRRVRARRDPAPRLGPVRGPAAGHRREPGHALLPRQLALRGPERRAVRATRRGAGLRRARPAPPDGQAPGRAASAGSTRTTRARSWSCTRWAWTAATRRRT